MAWRTASGTSVRPPSQPRRARGLTPSRRAARRRLRPFASRAAMIRPPVVRVVDPGLLDRVQLVALGQTVDGRHVLPRHRAHGRDAHTVGHTVDVARAGAAEAHATAVLQAVDVETVTKDPEQFFVVVVVVGVDGDRVAIECECDLRHRNQAHTFVLRASEVEAFGRCRRAWDYGARERSNLVPARPSGPHLRQAVLEALALDYLPAMDDWNRTIVRPLAVQAFHRALERDRQSPEAVTGWPTAEEEDRRFA